MALQLASDILPDVTGRDLGATGQYWDAFIRNLVVVGTVSGINVSANQLNTALQIISTLTGSPPMVIASALKVVNLNADLLDDKDWASPANIGTGTPATGKFTTLESTGLATFASVQVGADVLLERSAANTLRLATGDTLIPQSAGQVFGATATPWDVWLRTVRHKGVTGIAASGAGEGALYYDSATNKYRVSENGGSFSNLRSSSVEVLDSTEVAVNTSTTSDQILKTFTLDPAGSGAMNYVGACLYIFAIGEYNTGAVAPDVQVKLAIAGVVTLVTNVALPLQNSVSGQDWEFEARVYRRTTGTTGGGFGGGRVTMDGLASAAAVKLDTRTANWDDTIIQTLQLSVNFSVASATNLWRIRHWEIRRLA